jgi:hypothetical protein
MEEWFTLDDVRELRENLRSIQGQNTVYSQIGSWPDRHELKGKDREVYGEQQHDGVVASNEGAEGGEPNEEDGTPRLQGDLGEERAFHQSEAMLDDDEANTQRSQMAFDGEVAIQDTQAVPHDEGDGAPREPASFDTNISPRQGGSVPSNGQKQRTGLDSQPLEPFGRGNFGEFFDMDDQLQLLENSKRMTEDGCNICRKFPRKPLTASVCMKPGLRFSKFTDSELVRSYLLYEMHSILQHWSRSGGMWHNHTRERVTS